MPRIALPSGGRQMAWASLAVAGFAALPLMATPYQLSTLVVSMVFLLPALGLNLILGYTGMLSFGQSAFYGTGGVVAAWLLTRAGFPNVFLALIIGMISAAVVGYLVGLIALRRTGIYFAMITVAITRTAGSRVRRISKGPSYSRYSVPVVSI